MDRDWKYEWTEQQGRIGKWVTNLFERHDSDQFSNTGDVRMTQTQ